MTETSHNIILSGADAGGSRQSRGRHFGWILAWLCIAGWGGLTYVHAQSIYGEGPFAANFVGYAEADIPPIETISGKQIGLTNSTLTTMNAEGAAFLHNQTGRCLGWWQVDKAAATFEQHVHCTYTDFDGDQIFEHADFDIQALDGPRIGTGRWLGGTGKYLGLSGVFEIRVRTLRSARDYLVQYVGTKQGHYRLVAPKD